MTTLNLTIQSFQLVSKIKHCGHMDTVNLLSYCFNEEPMSKSMLKNIIELGKLHIQL